MPTCKFIFSSKDKLQDYILIAIYGIIQFYSNFSFSLFLMLCIPSSSSNALGTSSIIFTGTFAADLNKFINCAFFIVVVESHASIYFKKL